MRSLKTVRYWHISKHNGGKDYEYCIQRSTAHHLTQECFLQDSSEKKGSHFNFQVYI